MNYERWLKKNAGTLSGKRVAITGATGGIGRLGGVGPGR